MDSCKTYMDGVQRRLDIISGDLDVIIKAAEAKGIDTTPYMPMRVWAPEHPRRPSRF